MHVHCTLVNQQTLSRKRCSDEVSTQFRCSPSTEIYIGYETPGQVGTTLPYQKTGPGQFSILALILYIVVIDRLKPF